MFNRKYVNFQFKHIIHKCVNLFHVKLSFFEKFRRDKIHLLIQ